MSDSELYIVQAMWPLSTLLCRQAMVEFHDASVVAEEFDALNYSEACEIIAHILLRGNLGKS